MKLRFVFPSIFFGAALAASGGARDTLTITKMEDIHIMEQWAIDNTLGVMEPKNGNAKMLQIFGFKC